MNLIKNKKGPICQYKRSHKYCVTFEPKDVRLISCSQFDSPPFISTL